MRNLKPIKLCVTLCLFNFLLSGCGAILIAGLIDGDHESGSDYEYTPPTTSTSIDFKKASCEPDQSVSEDRVSQEMAVTLFRHSQRTIRYGCNEQMQPDQSVVLSDRWEEVKKPSTTIEIFPVGKDDPDSLVSLNKGKNINTQAYNKTTCDSDHVQVKRLLKGLFSAGILLVAENIEKEMNGPSIKVAIDLADTALNMRVREGLNFINYDFTLSCTESDEPCSKTELEKGTLILDVSYDLKEEGEIEEIRYVDECDPDKLDESKQDS